MKLFSHHYIVAFTKPGMLGDPSKRRPLVDFTYHPWYSFLKENKNLRFLSATQYFLYLFGVLNHFKVIGMRKARFEPVVFAKHYQHLFRIPGAVQNKWPQKMMEEYANQPLWFFLLYGSHEKAVKLRGPTDGSEARNPKSKNYNPFSLRAMYGENKLDPKIHMTDKTEYRVFENNEIKIKELSAETCGKIEAIRFFDLGEINEEFINWPVADINKIPEYTLFSFKFNKPNGNLKYTITPEVIDEFLQDFPEVSKKDLSAFLGQRSDLGLNSKPKPIKFVSIKL